jgi:HK97 gp10 family phage protein
MANGDNRFRGKAQALARFKAIPAAIKGEVRVAMAENRAELVEAIKARVPVDEGELRDTVRSYDASDEARIRSVVVEGEGMEPKARAQEFGRPDMEPQPHFFPTYREKKRKFRNRLARAATRGAKRAFNP